MADAEKDRVWFPRDTGDAWPCPFLPFAQVSWDWSQRDTGGGYPWECYLKQHSSLRREKASLSSDSQGGSRVSAECETSTQTGLDAQAGICLEFVFDFFFFK